jgi:hypothetical protein
MRLSGLNVIWHKLSDWMRWASRRQTVVLTVRDQVVPKPPPRLPVTRWADLAADLDRDRDDR